MNILLRIGKIVLTGIGAPITLLVLLIFSAGLWYGCSTGAFSKASDIKIPDPYQAVMDARKIIIDEYQLNKKEYEIGRPISLEELPPSLQIKGVRMGIVFTNHFNLQMGRNPDWSVGARIWSEDTVVPEADQLTSYSNVYFYTYCNDYPISPNNQP
jgi:hypothetical protein